MCHAPHASSSARGGTYGRKRGDHSHRQLISQEYRWRGMFALINAVTGQVGSRINLSGNPTHHPKSEAQITIRAQGPIDGENCAEDFSRKSCLGSNFRLPKKRTSSPCHFDTSASF